MKIFIHAPLISRHGFTRALLPALLLTACTGQPQPQTATLNITVNAQIPGHFTITTTQPDGTTALLGGSNPTTTPISPGPAQFTYQSQGCKKSLSFTTQAGETITIMAGKTPAPSGQGWTCFAHAQAILPNGSVKQLH
jgi:hypothetical protein